ncbi:MAG: alpha/beta hydrolase [Alphaproteobacteria bacterium]|jgi:predicted alpha/beta hydrolase family esterase|nr:alpha/beta hydrolase [Alphaproteobacteria bacterium]
MTDAASINTPILIVPGLGGSGPDHWQTRWARLHPEFVTVLQDDWHRPDLAAWIARLDDAVQACKAPPVLVAHSLACLLVPLWDAACVQRTIRAALLVAPPDPANLPAEAAEFADLPQMPLTFPSLVVCSSDDPWCSPGRARQLAGIWHSEIVEIGAAGHINSESGLGDWPAGYALLQQLAG